MDSDLRNVLQSLLGIAANGAMVAGMATGGPWGLAAGTVVSSILMFSDQVFLGGGGHGPGVDYAKVTGQQINAAVEKIKQQVSLDFNQLNMAHLMSAQDWFSTNLKTFLNSPFNPSTLDLDSKLNEVETEVILRALDAMNWSKLRIENKQDTAKATLGMYSVAATLLLNACKYQISIRRVADARDVLEQLKTNPNASMADVKSYPEYGNMKNYLKEIKTFLKPQIEEVNKHWMDATSQMSSVPDAAEAVFKGKTYSTPREWISNRVLERGRILSAHQELPNKKQPNTPPSMLPLSYMNWSSMKLLNTTYANLNLVIT